MLGDPELLFLDEPTNGMDPEGMAEIRELVRGLGADGRTVLLSSHLLHEVEQVCDSVTIISRGRLIAQGVVADLLRARRREQIRVKTTDDVRARETLSALEWVEDVAAEAGYLLVTAPIARSGDLTSALSQAGVSVTEMAPVQTSLEEYFLEVTGDDSEETG